MVRTKRVLFEALLISLAALTVAFGDGVQPIVAPKGILYGSNGHTIISSSTQVFVDTTTLQATFNKGIKTSSLTFQDATFLTSTNGIVAVAAWGTLTGKTTNQADMTLLFTNVGTSTASLQAQLNNVATATATLTTSISNLGISTGAIAASTGTLSASTTTIQTQVNAIVTSTSSLQTSINGINTTLTAVATSTNSLQSQITAFTTSTNTLQTQINNVATSTGTLSTSTTALQNQINGLPTLPSTQTWTGFNTYISTNGISVSFKVAAGSVSVANVLSSLVATDSFGNLISTAVTTNLASQVSGILPIANGGTGTSSPALVAGAGVTLVGAWPNTTISAVSGGASALAISSGSASNSVIVTSPTSNVVIDSNTLIVVKQGSTTSYFTLNPGSATLQGNTFNGPSQLVKLSAGSQLPAVDGNLLTNLNATALGPGSSNYIQNTSVLQTGSTFYVSSGTVAGTLTQSTSTVTTLLHLNYGSSLCIPHLSTDGSSSLLCDNRMTSQNQPSDTTSNGILLGHLGSAGGQGFMIDQDGWTQVFEADREEQSASYFQFNHGGTTEGRFGLENNGGNWTFRRSGGGNQLLDMDMLTAQTTFAYGIKVGSITVTGASGTNAINSTQGNISLNNGTVFMPSDVRFLGAGSGYSGSTGLTSQMTCTGSGCWNMQDQMAAGAGSGQMTHILDVSVMNAVNQGGQSVVGWQNGVLMKSTQAVSAYYGIFNNPQVTNMNAGAVPIFGMYSAIQDTTTQANVDYGLVVDETQIQNSAATRISGLFKGGQFIVQGSTGNAYTATFSTGTNLPYHVAISTSGHFITMASTTPAVTVCGTQPTISGDDNQGTITPGSGAPTACTMTFLTGWGATPTCTFISNGASTPSISAISQSAVTFTLSITETKIYYRCGCSGSTCL